MLSRAKHLSWRWGRWPGHGRALVGPAGDGLSQPQQGGERLKQKVSPL